MNTTTRTTLLAVGLVFATGAVAAKPDNGKGKGNDNGKGRAESGDFTPPGLVNKGGVPPGLQRAPVEVVVKAAPPAVRVEKMPPRPAPDYVWVAGYWSWNNADYVWVPGVWVAPPQPAAVWVAPRYEARSGVSVYISGYWKL